MSDHAVAEDSWAADMLYGAEPTAAPPTQNLEDDGADMSADEAAEADERDGDVEFDSWTMDPGRDADAGAKKVAIALGVGTVCAAMVIAIALTSFHDNAPASPTTAPAPVYAPTPAPQSAAPPPPDSDRPIPYTASANCPAGSTSAQALTDTTSDSAWVCVRGPQGATVDGQVLHVEFGHSYVVAAVTATPGWVAKTSGGKDEWLQHRVVTRLQYMFNDTDRTVVTQDTADTHGPVTMALPKKVLVSGATIVILQTSRPPASPLPATEPDPSGLLGFGDSLLGSDGAPLQPDATSSTDPLPVGDQAYDPVDATFAMSQLTFVGHEPN